MNLKNKNKLIELLNEVVRDRMADKMREEHLMSDNIKSKKTKLVADKIANDTLIMAVDNLMDELKKV